MEGVIKYRMHYEPGPLPQSPHTEELLHYRNLLWQQKLIGVDAEGIGYGNMSVRHGQGFIITGTQTGHLPSLKEENLSWVQMWNIPANQIWCGGPAPASSEALTHGALYALDFAVGAVIHMHHAPTWTAWLNKALTTRARVPYGTPAMAEEMCRLYQQTDLSEACFLVMAGHRDGLISFGRNVAEAYETLKKWLVISS